MRIHEHSHDRFEITRSLEEMELALVRAACLNGKLVTPVEEAILRTALSLARLYRLSHGGNEVEVGALLDPFRDSVTRRLAPILLGSRIPTRDQLLPLLDDLKKEAIRTRDEVIARLKDRIPAETIHRELREKALVLVAGGGGGTGYVYLGVMSMLDEFGVRPSLLVGTSIGAVLCLFRSRMASFDHTEMVNIVRGLSWRKLFRVISTENRYGLPAALRLFLRAGIGRYFNAGPEPARPGVRLSELPIPTIVAVSGIRRGMLPHPVEFYERLLNFNPMSFGPTAMTRVVQQAMSAVAEFFSRPEMMVPLHLGLDEGTREFDALDAAGFSSALPGVIHYDMLRDDSRMKAMLDELFESRGLFRLVDGGLTNNLPARAAWHAVHQGFIGTRNAFILALNGFAPKITTPLWLPLQRLAAMTAAPNRPYSHFLKDFKRTLSPLDLVPSVETLSRAMELGKSQLQDDMPFICRMLAPLPRL